MFGNFGKMFIRKMLLKTIASNAITLKNDAIISYNSFLCNTDFIFYTTRFVSFYDAFIHIVSTHFFFSTFYVFFDICKRNKKELKWARLFGVQVI